MSWMRWRVVTRATELRRVLDATQGSNQSNPDPFCVDQA